MLKLYQIFKNVYTVFMTVLMFHSTEQLKLVALQKKLTAALNNRDVIFYAHMPLWLELPQNLQQTDLKSLSKSIKKITVVSFVCNSDTVFLKFQIDVSDNKYFAELPLIHKYKGDKEDKFNMPEQKELPFEMVTIFRLGIQKKLSSNSKCITESKWVKMR